MPCYSPNHVFNGGIKENGRKLILWKAPAGTPKEVLPCGKCVGCRLEYAFGWSCRCILESKFHSENSFITLTYDEANLPLHNWLDYRDFQLFLKRLRKERGNGIRFFMCGEYGAEYGRPHFHAILFGCDFPDKVFHTIRHGRTLYKSVALSRLWPYGFASIGTVTVESASYVARYSLKKALDLTVLTFKDDDFKKRMMVDKRTGELKIAEFTQMSRRPGIASQWFNQFSSDLYPSDQMVIDGSPRKVPRYFDKLLDKLDADLLEDIRTARRDKMPSWEEVTEERLLVMEKVKLAQIKLLQRSL